MKYLSIMLIFLFSTNLAYSQDLIEDRLVVTEDYVEAIFDANSTQESLDQIKSKLSESNITLVYKELEFSKNGKLNKIAFFVDCNDGFSGSTTQIFKLNKFKVGFYRDYRKEAKSAFGTGTID